MKYISATVALAALLVASQGALAAQRCVLTGEVKRCQNSFGPGTVETFGDVRGNVSRINIDVPDTSADAEKVLAFLGMAMTKFAPKMTPDQRGEALKKLLTGKEPVRMGDWNWSATFIQKHLTLAAIKL